MPDDALCLLLAEIGQHGDRDGTETDNGEIGHPPLGRAWRDQCHPLSPGDAGLPQQGGVTPNLPVKRPVWHRGLGHDGKRGLAGKFADAVAQDGGQGVDADILMGLHGLRGWFCLMGHGLCPLSSRTGVITGSIRWRTMPPHLSLYLFLRRLRERLGNCRFPLHWNHGLEDGGEIGMNHSEIHSRAGCGEMINPCFWPMDVNDFTIWDKICQWR
jgi:hypothetical protein